MLVALRGTHQSLLLAQGDYYQSHRFADVFASAKRAPLALERQLEGMKGAAHVQTSLAEVVPVSIAHVPDPIVGRLIGLDVQSAQRLNQVHLRRGRMVQAQHGGAAPPGAARTSRHAHAARRAAGRRRNRADPRSTGLDARAF